MSPEAVSAPTPEWDDQPAREEDCEEPDEGAEQEQERLRRRTRVLGCRRRRPKPYEKRSDRIGDADSDRDRDKTVNNSMDQRLQGRHGIWVPG